MFCCSVKPDLFAHVSFNVDVQCLTEILENAAKKLNVYALKSKSNQWLVIPVHDGIY